MLNRFKIGIKLMCGFAIVLVLLVVVWQVGRWAVNQKTVMSKEVARAEALTTAGLSMQRDIYDAMISVNMETLTREEKYAIEVQEIAKKINENHEKDFELMQRDDVKKKYRVILGKAAEFAETDAKAWNTEVERKKAADTRLKLALKLVEDVGKLADAIDQVTQDPQNQFAITQDDVIYYAAERVIMVREVADMTNAVRDIRRLCDQYGLAVDDDGRKKVRDEILLEYKKIEFTLEDLEPRFVSAEGKKLHGEIRDDYDEWFAAVELVMTLDNRYAGFDAKTTQIADELVALIGELLPVFEEQAKEATVADEKFSAWILWVLFITSIVAVLLGTIVSYVLSRDIGGGVRAAAGGITHITTTGDLTFEVPQEYLARKDEVGDLAHCVTQMLDTFRGVATVAKDLAAGDWRDDVKIRGDLDAMNQDLSSMLKQVNHTLHQINDSVKQVATGSSEVSTASVSLSNGAQEAAASLEEITASMSEISSQTKQNAESASQARDLAHKASKAAAEGQGAMQEMTGAMDLITKNSNEIQRVIKVIDDIAFQTNLLALNAAVEAARAGQHGKGFAVVAEEVRNLASRSAKAAQETSDLIAKSGQEIQKGGEVAARTAGVLNTIVDQIKQTTDLVAGIAVASNEQAEGVSQVTVGLQQIDAVTQQNTASAEESASAANEMSSMASNLQKLVGQFKLR